MNANDDNAPTTDVEVPGTPAEATQETPKPRVITQHGIESMVGQFKTLRVDQPFGVGFRANRLPHFFTEIVGQ